MEILYWIGAVTGAIAGVAAVVGLSWKVFQATDRKLEQFEAVIKLLFTPNGGTSIKDQLNRIEKQLAPLAGLPERVEELEQHREQVS